MISGILYECKRAHGPLGSAMLKIKTWILFTKLFYPDPSCY